jgi:hypothetical protein
MPNLTGKTIGQLITLTGITIDTLFAVEYSGITYNIPFSTITQTFETGYLPLSGGTVTGVTVFNSGVTINPDLDVTGKTKTNTLQVMSGASPGYVLTSDGNGNATWQPTVTGGTVYQPVTFNSGVTSTEVITPQIKTDNDIKFSSTVPNKRAKFSSDEKTFVDLTSGEWSVGVTTPTAKMHIAGTTNDSSQYAVKVEDSSGTTNFSIRNDGLVTMALAKTSFIESNSPLLINNGDQGNVYFGSLSAITVDVDNIRIGVGTLTPTESLDVTGNTKIGGTLNIGTIGGGSPIINLGLDNSGNVVTGTTGSITYSGVGFSFRQQLTSVNPSQLSTYYTTVVSSSSLFSSPTLNKYNIPFNCTLIGCTITTYALGSGGSNELSTVYFRINNNTDVLLSNNVSFSGTAPLMQSVINSSLSQSLNVNDEVQIKWETPNWMSIPTSCGIFVDLHFIKN